MQTLEITYTINRDKPRESYAVIQFIKRTLMKIAQGYTQTTDSATNPNIYTFRIEITQKDVSSRVQEALSRIIESPDNTITLLTTTN